MNKKPNFAIAWDALPRLVCWKIWNARNKKIFEEKAACFKKVSAAAKNLWVDTLATRRMKNIINEPLTVEERTWLANILWNTFPSSNSTMKPSLPCWILANRKALTAENLRKRGIASPLRCVLCKEEEESLKHVFTECNFTQQVWREMLKELRMNITLPTSWYAFFFSWKDYYQGTLNKKPNFAKAWDSIPRFVC